MIVGENAKNDDFEVNPMKTKQLTNFRASGGKDDAVRLAPPRRMTLEQAIAYIDDDELVEVTPKSIRLRKTHLDPNERKKASRAKVAALGGGGKSTLELSSASLTFRPTARIPA